MSVQPSPAVVEAAQLAQKAWGIPASVSLAQYGLESGWGQHMPPGSNNPFGIKAKPGEPMSAAITREVIHGHDVMVHAGFRAFGSIAEAFDCHAKLLATAGAYAAARSLLPDVDAFCHALTGVYATDPRYGDLLVKIIDGSDLRRFNIQPSAPQ